MKVFTKKIFMRSHSFEDLNKDLVNYHYQAIVELSCSPIVLRIIGTLEVSNRGQRTEKAFEKMWNKYL